MHQDWKTQNIVVTGAASGLGLAMCTRFIRLDASVRGIDINKAQLEKMKAAAVIGMTKVQGKEVAGTGVTVNACSRCYPDPDGTGAPGAAGQIHDRQDPNGSLRHVG